MRRLLVWGLLGVAVVMVVAGVAYGFVRHISDDTSYTANWSGRGTPTISADGRALTLTYLGGDCDRSAHADQHWSQTQVVVTVRVRSASQCDSRAVLRTLVVRLDRVLGDRVVLAGGCGTSSRCRFHPQVTS